MVKGKKGELEALNIEPVSSTNFTPLSDALCSVILQLNRRNVSADIVNIKHHLQQLYSQVEPPSDQIIFEALNNLMREKKVCLADTGYLLAGGAHRKPLSIVISNPKVQPVLVVSPSKQQRKTFCITSPPLKNKEDHKKLKENNAIYNNENGGKCTWAGAHADGRKKSGAKDKGATLRKFFGLKSKGKKASNSADRMATSSGCSSEASHASSNDDDEGVVELHQVTHCGLDTRTVSQLSAELVPFQITQLPVGSLNESMAVHCGTTIIKDPLHPDSDYETESEAEHFDRVPEMRRHQMKRNRHRATTRLVKKPGHAAPRQRVNSLNSTEYDSSSHYYSSSYRRKHRKLSYRSSDRNSTKRSLSRMPSQLVSSLPPDVSSINMCTATSKSQLLLYSTIQSESPDSLSKGSRQSADGQASDAAHHSTPKNINSQSSKSKPVFNATGHTHCDEGYRDCVQTPLVTRKSNHQRKCAAVPTNTNNNSNSSADDPTSIYSSDCGTPPTTCKKVLTLQTHL